MTIKELIAELSKYEGNITISIDNDKKITIKYIYLILLVLNAIAFGYGFAKDYNSVTLNGLATIICLVICWYDMGGIYEFNKYVRIIYKKDS